MSFDMPSYVIMRDIPEGHPMDLTAPLAFFPPKDSDELFDALRAKYPRYKTHSERMRQAVIDYLLEEQLSAQIINEDITAAPMEQPNQLPTPQTAQSVNLSPWEASLQSFSSDCSSWSSPEMLGIRTPDFVASPASQNVQPHTRQSSSVTSPTAGEQSTPALEQMTGVFSLSDHSQPKQRIRRKMTEAEKIEYRKRRIVKACEKCAQRKRKCIHNQPEMESTGVSKAQKVTKPAAQFPTKRPAEHANVAISNTVLSDISAMAEVAMPSFDDFTMMSNGTTSFQDFDDLFQDQTWLLNNNAEWPFGEVDTTLLDFHCGNGMQQSDLGHEAVVHRGFGDDIGGLMQQQEQPSQGLGSPQVPQQPTHTRHLHDSYNIVGEGEIAQIPPAPSGVNATGQRAVQRETLQQAPHMPRSGQQSSVLVDSLHNNAGGQENTAIDEGVLASFRLSRVKHGSSSLGEGLATKASPAAERYMLKRGSNAAGRQTASASLNPLLTAIPDLSNSSKWTGRHQEVAAYKARAGDQSSVTSSGHKQDATANQKIYCTDGRVNGGAYLRLTSDVYNKPNLSDRNGSTLAAPAHTRPRNPSDSGSGSDANSGPTLETREPARHAVPYGTPSEARIAWFHILKNTAASGLVGGTLARATVEDASPTQNQALVAYQDNSTNRHRDHFGRDSRLLEATRVQAYTLASLVGALGMLYWLFCFASSDALSSPSVLLLALLLPLGGTNIDERVRSSRTPFAKQLWGTDWQWIVWNSAWAAAKFVADGKERVGFAHECGGDLKKESRGSWAKVTERPASESSVGLVF